MTKVMAPSPAMRMKALGAKPSAAAARRSAGGRLMLSRRPPPAAALACRSLRREKAVMVSLPSALGSVLDRGTDAAVGAAAADVAGHRRVDVGVGRLGGVGEQRCRRHDLA